MINNNNMDNNISINNNYSCLDKVINSNIYITEFFHNIHAIYFMFLMVLKKQ